MASGQEPIEFDPECVGTAIDNDEGESVRDSTTSITASLYEYRELHGRTYQSSKTTEYWAPNDQKHISAFDVAHQWLTMMLSDKLYAAPIPPNPSHILDIGTGTDISPTQPSWTPPNLTFLIDDAQLEWPFPDNHFDFIHIRYLHGGITSWPQFYSQVFRCLKPGGYFQQIEPNIELRCDNPAASDQVYQQWAHLFYEAGDKINRSFRINEEIMTGWARGAGFEDITHTKFKIPIGAWPKDKRLKAMGTFTELYMDLSLDGFALFPIGQILGWTLEEVQALVANMRKAVHDPNNRSNSDMHMVYGRKPLA